jgi:GNAT superfamily N-acetyltransferase
MIKIETLSGTKVKALIPELARLRIRIFREYPYLYEGSSEYEERYLLRFAQSEDSVMVVARDGDIIIGVSTGVPLAHEGKELRVPFEDAGLLVEEWFYFAESVLLPEYRGLGIGKRFMEERILHACNNGYKYACFCSVVRPDDHPQRPVDYQSLDRFWNSMKFTKKDELITHFSWKEVGESMESSKAMVFWVRDL